VPGEVHGHGDADHPASCECLGHLRHGHRIVCKHIACTRALLQAGKLAASPPCSHPDTHRNDDTPAAPHPRFGYRRVWALLRQEGWRVNRKRVYRLWRRQGLKVPRSKRKKRRLGQKGNGCSRRRALARNHVWAWDFIHDRTADGRPLK
jgi:hypothetical protein